jgi:hypothetical protein
MRSNKKFDLYCWACDFSPNRGEGILAQHYIKKLSKKFKKKIFIMTPQGSFCSVNGIIKINNKTTRNVSKLNFNFFENYLTPLVGILYLWVNYLRGRGICYVNFLPLWNIFLFFLLPPRTHLGPVTGFIFKKKVTGVNSFLRKYLNVLLFKINLKVLLFRQNKIYLSTDLLKSLFTNNTKRKVSFNYLINLVEIENRINKKNIDFLIYNRNYSVKNNYSRNRLLKSLIELNLTIYAIGDHLLLSGVKNLGYVTRKKTIKLLKRTKFIINSGENPYNLFTIDAFNNHANIIYEKRFIHKIKFFTQQKLFFLDFHNNHKILNFFKKYSSNIKYSSLTKEFANIKNANSAYFDFIKIHYSKN